MLLCIQPIYLTILQNFADVQAIDDQGNVVAAAARRRMFRSRQTRRRVVVRQADIGDFGSCSIPEIDFAAGFDGRKETAFQPKDLASFNHGSAQNIDIITRAICDVSMSPL